MKNMLKEHDMLRVMGGQTNVVVDDPPQGGADRVSSGGIGLPSGSPFAWMPHYAGVPKQITKPPIRIDDPVPFPTSPI